MGLDISAYSKLEPVDGDTGNSVRFSVESCFASRADGVRPGVDYAFRNEFHFRAGSYGIYNDWRDQLARLAGYLAASDTWGDSVPCGPFWELLNFSDCMGTIGPYTSGKLFRHFEMYADQAEKIGGDFYGAYLNWLAAFRLAADGGAVSFH